MSISNFGELKAKLSATLFHARFAPQYANATIMFEAAANRRLRVRQMETSTDLTTSSGDVAVPTDYLVWRTVLHTGTNPYIELDYVHPAYLNSTWTEGAEGKIFTIEGSTFKARPIDDTADIYEFHYYQKIPTIADSSDAATNWLLTAYPDAYIYGVLTELFALQRNLEAAQLYKARRDETFAEIIQLSALTTGATSPMVRTSEYF
jgi:hypothetical protein